eukprot:Pgem_evm1s3742
MALFVDFTIFSQKGGFKYYVTAISGQIPTYPWMLISGQIPPTKLPLDVTYYLDAPKPSTFCCVGIWYKIHNGDNDAKIKNLQ